MSVAAILSCEGAHVGGGVLEALERTAENIRDGLLVSTTIAYYYSIAGLKVAPRLG